MERKFFFFEFLFFLLLSWTTHTQSFFGSPLLFPLSLLKEKSSSLSLLLLLLSSFFFFFTRNEDEVCLVVMKKDIHNNRQGMMDDDDDENNTDNDTDDEEEEVFNPIERFQQSREKEETSKASGSSHQSHLLQSSSDEKKGVKKLKFVIRPKEEKTAAATGATDDEKEEGKGRSTVQSTREMFEKFSLKPPPGFSSNKATTPFPSSSSKKKEKKEEKEEKDEEERNEGWLTHGNDAWQETRGHEEESEREEKYVDELTHTAKKKYGKYAFVEEASSPSGILSDLQVAEPLEFDSVKTKERTNKSDNSSNRNNNNNNKREEEEVDVSESFLLESSMENDPFKSDDEFDDVRKLEIRNANRARSPPNEDQVAHAGVLVQSGIVKFNLNDLRGALCDFQNACVLLRDNYHSGDIAFAKAKTHLVAAFLILKCEENKGNVDLCAKLARTLATVTYMADESVFGGFSQQFLLSPKLICRCLRFASAKNFHAKYYLAAKEYLEILLKPFFCADPNTEAALNGMKTQCENAEKQQHGTTRKVDEMESQKRARDIIDELFEEARGG